MFVWCGRIGFIEFIFIVLWGKIVLMVFVGCGFGFMLVFGIVLIIWVFSV